MSVNVKRWLGSAAIGSALLLGAIGAEAAEHEGGERLPVSFVERGIVVGRRILNPTVEFSLLDISPLPTDNTFEHLTIAARYGITENAQIQATVVPLVFHPDVPLVYGPDNHTISYTTPTLGVTFRFLHGRHFELGGSFDLGIAFDEPELGIPYPSTGVLIQPGLESRAHLGKRGSLDINVLLPINTVGGRDEVTGETKLGIGLKVPVVLAVDVTEPFHLGVSSGLNIENFDEASKTAAIPLGLLAGFAVRGRHGSPIVDIDPFFRWPFFATPGSKIAEPASSPSNIHPDIWELGLELGGFLYF